MKTALVLSGGGMFGAYQAGVWKALSREFAPDIVVGASVGALNGWLIAGGATAEDLVEQWLDPASGELMAYRLPRSPWSGMFDPRPLRARAKFLVGSYRPRMDYGAVVVQLPWLRQKLVRNGEVTWRHLVASCSVPGGFPPVRIGASLYCDGGLLDATPVWAAAEMGATRVIAVNASRFLPPPMISIMIKGVRLLGKARRRAAHGLEITLITPQNHLGKMLEGASWRKDKIRRWIELGEADAGVAFASKTFSLYNVLE
jgi:NTE family protein